MNENLPLFWMFSEITCTFVILLKPANPVATMSKFVENFEKKSIRVNNVEFCRVCGSILDIPESGNIECGICHWTCHLSGELLKWNSYI